MGRLDGREARFSRHARFPAGANAFDKVALFFEQCVLRRGFHFT